jgi:hypothetical protein
VGIDRLRPLQPSGSNQRLVVASGVVAGLLIVGAMRWWDGANADGAPTSAAPAAAATARDAQTWARPGASVDEPAPAEPGVADSAAVEDSPDASFREYVAGKYRFLSQRSERLQAALLEREELLVALNTARQSADPAAKEAIPRRQAQLAELDRKIGTLLHPADLAAYDVLKDSDIEQFQLEDYAGGIRNVAPLNDADKQAILYTKLVHRQRFRRVLNDSGLMRGDLSAAERQVVFADVSRALKDSRDSYLQEVRQYLSNDEQFSLLSNYENSEFDAELAKLRGIAYGD